MLIKIRNVLKIKIKMRNLYEGKVCENCNEKIRVSNFKRCTRRGIIILWTNEMRTKYLDGTNNEIIRRVINLWSISNNKNANKYSRDKRNVSKWLLESKFIKTQM